MEEIICETLQPILELMHIPFRKIDVQCGEEGHYRVNIETDEPQHLIGAHGATLFSLQHILKILLTKKIESGFSIALDVDNYRKRQEDSVILMAEQKVDLVRKYGTPRRLPPMSPYFRRLVHLHLTTPDFEDMKTKSEGEGTYRAVVIFNASPEHSEGASVPFSEAIS
jgi:spoIIIJ-associated protein